jgi:hypothetical protein
VAESYTGPVRILGDDGVFLTTGVAALEDDPDSASWKGLVQTLRGTAVAGKALVVELQTPEGGHGRAQLTPQGEVGERYTSSVTGLGDRPF